METKSHKDIKILQYIAIGLGIIGFIILFYFILVLVTQKIIDFKLIELDKFSQFGDFIGGLIGSIWALAGVLLFYVALVYQRRELEETIKSRDDLTVAYNKQIEAAEIQKFQSSFFELFKLFFEKKNEIGNVGWTKSVTELSLTMAFDDATNMAIEYAIECNRNYMSSMRRLVALQIYLFDYRYNEKLTELCELLLILVQEIESHKRIKDIHLYERKLINSLTYKQIAAILLFAVLDQDNTSRLKKYILRSDEWHQRCIEILTIEEDLLTFWLTYRSLNSE